MYNNFAGAWLLLVRVVKYVVYTYNGQDPF